MANEAENIAPEAIAGIVEEPAAEEVVKTDAPAAPSEEKGDEAPAAAPTAEEAPAELYELPDGRKVDAQTLTKEWKENFLPEFTRKSQELATLKPNNPNPVSDPANPALSEDWVPQTYAEIVKVAETQVINTIAAQQQEAAERQQQVEAEIEKQLGEIRKADPSLDEARLFQHANKYQFSDLKLAHENMVAMSQAAKAVETKVKTNIANRANEPVSGRPSGAPEAGGIDWARTQNSRGVSALEFLQGLSK